MILSFWNQYKFIPDTIIKMITAYYGEMRKKSVYKRYIPSPGKWISCTPRFDADLSDVLITNVSYGIDFSLYLDREGCIYSRGDNTKSQLGVSYGKALTHDYVTEPMLISSFVDHAGSIINKVRVIQICTGYYHSLILSEHGGVCAWGDNSKGQCGVGKMKQIVHKPQIIEALMGNEIMEIQAHEYNSYARSKDDKHWIWGDNKYGICSMEQRPTPKEKDIQYVPYRLDEIFLQRTSKRIDRAYLEYESLYVIPT